MISTYIRKYLHAHPDGATAAQIAEVMGKPVTQISAILTTMPDLYRDRWVTANMGWAAVWVAVKVPEDCPKPAKRKATA